jgi:hypothetical protein
MSGNGVTLDVAAMTEVLVELGLNKLPLFGAMFASMQLQLCGGNFGGMNAIGSINTSLAVFEVQLCLLQSQIPRLPWLYRLDVTWHIYARV